MARDFIVLQGKKSQKYWAHFKIFQRVWAVKDLSGRRSTPVNTGS